VFRITYTHVNIKNDSTNTLDLHQRRIERVPLPGTKYTRCFDDNRKEYVMGT